MCGINGIFAYHRSAPQPEEIELLAMRDRMRSRGPDGYGAWWSSKRHCGLGHRRLSIIDLSDRASQPMIGEDEKTVVVFNGEIYNYPSLRAALMKDGARFKTNSDTEVLLHLYTRYGREMVHQLRGMFAFAIWDERKRGILFARDPYGIKPLYTANDGLTFRFASQVKALLAGGKLSRDLEPAGVVGFHLFGSVPEPFTLYREICALPAGHTQWVDEAGAREPEPYASIAAILQDGHRNSIPIADVNGFIREAVRNSTSAHLLADVEVGIFLSAGIDSGALLGIMKDISQREIRAITLGFDEFRGTQEDEGPYAAGLAERYGVRHILRRVGEKEFSEDLPAIFDAMDQPSIDGVNTWFVAKAAKEAGLKVAVSGLGGDELLGGYPSFLNIPRWRRQFGLFGHVPGLGRLFRSCLSTFAPALVADRPKAVGMLEYSASWGGAYLLCRGVFLPHELKSFLGPDVAREGLQRLQPLQRLATSITPDPRSNIGRVCALESSFYLRNQLLRDADWAGMAHSIEIRTPLVDIDILKQLAPVLPRLSLGEGKAALAQAPAVPLPKAIVSRAKSGFGVPTGAWMAKSLGSRSLKFREPKGLVSRNWAQVVLANLLAGDKSREQSRGIA